MTPKFVDGNKLQLLRNGTAYFPALRQAIDVAKGEIYLETYIFRMMAVAALRGDRTPVATPGRYLVVVDTQRAALPAWARRP